MQQQEILFRKSTLKLLVRAETLRQTWNTYQTATLQLLSTLVNLGQQQTLPTDRLQEDYNVDPSRLLYNQTCRFEKTIAQLRTRMDQWQQVVLDWQQLSLDAQHNAAKAPYLPQGNTPLSSHSLLQVTAVSPIQAFEWIMRLAHVYEQQYHRKRMLLLQMETDIATIMDHWSDPDHLLELSRELSERITLFNQVKKTIESV